MRFTSSGFSGRNGSSIALRSPDGIDPALDAELFHQLGKTERAADHADRADDGELVADDFVGGASQHVAARGADVLDEGEDREILLLRPDARMRRKIRCDCAGEPPGELISSATARALRVENARSSVRATPASVSPGRSGVDRADDAGKSHHRHHRDIGAETFGNEPAQGARNAFENAGHGGQLVSPWKPSQSRKEPNRRRKVNSRSAAFYTVSPRKCLTLPVF